MSALQSALRNFPEELRPLLFTSHGLEMGGLLLSLPRLHDAAHGQEVFLLVRLDILGGEGVFPLCLLGTLQLETFPAGAEVDLFHVQVDLNQFAIPNFGDCFTEMPQFSPSLGKGGGGGVLSLPEEGGLNKQKPLLPRLAEASHHGASGLLAYNPPEGDPQVSVVEFDFHIDDARGCHRVGEEGRQPLLHFGGRVFHPPPTA